MVELKQVTNSVWDYYFDELESHISLIKLSNYLVFVDSGLYPGIARDVRNTAEELLGLPVKKLILTHHHEDHLWGAQEFEDCEIIASKPVLDIMKKKIKEKSYQEFIEQYKKEYPDRYTNFRITLPTYTFEKKFQIKDEFMTIEIYQTDGHSEGSSFVYIPEESVLVAGDLLFTGMIPYFGDSTANVYKWIDCYNLMLDLSPEKIIPGHGNITNKNEIISQKEYLIHCVNWMENFIRNGRSKEKLVESKDFPIYPGEIPVDNFEEMLNDSKNQTYNVVKSEMKKMV